MLGLIILLPIIVLWFVIMPAAALLVWPFGRVLIACTRIDMHVPYWMETPWDLLVGIASWCFCVRIQDADGQHSLLLPGVRSMRCAVLANHRSWGDFFIDPAMSNCAVMARIFAVAATCVAGLIGLACGKIIVINRGKDSRITILAKAEKHERYLYARHLPTLISES